MHSLYPHGIYRAIRDLEGQILGHKKEEEGGKCLRRGKRKECVDLRTSETSEELSPAFSHHNRRNRLREGR